jgi:hypothetical protein
MALEQTTTFTLILTDSDKKNLLTFLNRATTTGIEEAQMLVAYAKAIKEAPPGETKPHAI